MPIQPSKKFTPPVSRGGGFSGTVANPSSVTVQNGLVTRVAAGTASDAGGGGAAATTATSFQVLVDANDTTPGFLSVKIVSGGYFAWTVNGSPGNETYTVGFTAQAANAVLAGPGSGSSATPTFRALVAADLPLATATDFGSVKPDGVTITVSAGVLSAVGGGGGANQLAAQLVTATNQANSGITQAGAVAWERSSVGSFSGTTGIVSVTTSNANDLVIITATNAQQPLVSVSGGGGSWSSPTTSGGAIGIAYAIIPTAGTYTITATAGAGNTSGNIIADVYSGAALSSAVAIGAAASGTGTAISASVTTAANNSLTAMSMQSSNAQTAGTGYTINATQGHGATERANSATSTSGTVVTPTATQTSAGWNAFALTIAPNTDLIIDGVTVTAGMIILETGQTTATQNGLWTAAVGAWTRPSSFATGTIWQPGQPCSVYGGTANAATIWMLTNTSAVTVDTSSETWTHTH